MLLLPRRLLSEEPSREIPIMAILGLELRHSDSGISTMRGISTSFAKTKYEVTKSETKPRNNGFITASEEQWVEPENRGWSADREVKL